MFLTRIVSQVYGRSCSGAKKKYAPDGRLIAEFTLACGNGTVRYPTMYVKVCVWEDVAEKVYAVIDRKGMNVEVGGYLVARLYEGKFGKTMIIELKEVCEVRVYSREGILEQVLAGEKITEQGVR